VQEHLDITIDKVDPSMGVPVNEFDGKVTYGQKRKNTGIGRFLQLEDALNVKSDTKTLT
jgi:hypothetical protein